MNATIIAIILSALAGGTSAVVTFMIARRTSKGSVETSDARTVFDGLTKLVDASIKRVDDIQSELDAARGEITQLEAEIAVLRAKADEAEMLGRQLAEAESRFSQLRSDYESLRVMVDDMQKRKGTR